MDPHWPHRSGAGDTGGQGGDPVVPNTVAFGPVPSRGASGYPAGGGADAQGQRRGMPGQFAGFDSSASGPAASPGMPSAFMGSRAGLGLSHGGAAPRGAPLTAAESASQQLVGDVKRVDIAGVSYKEILDSLQIESLALKKLWFLYSEERARLLREEMVLEAALESRFGPAGEDETEEEDGEGGGEEMGSAGEAGREQQQRQQTGAATGMGNLDAVLALVAGLGAGGSAGTGAASASAAGGGSGASQGDADAASDVQADIEREIMRRMTDDAEG